MASLLPPLTVRGMKSLNKELFNKTVSVASLKIDESKLSNALKYLKKYFLKMDNLKPIQGTQGNPVKYVYLNPSSIKSWTDLCTEDREGLIGLGITEKCFQNVNIELRYENWKADEVLRAILPEDKDSVTSYSNIGHIVHVNLKDHHLEYKDVIGAVLLDKIKGCQTVINKTNTIDNTFRNFHLEVLCGKPEFQAKVKENNCVFEFDFSKVYWNPRLSTEHSRVVDKLKKGDVLFDVFAGVGPFSIPSAKNNCIVYANDLNPDSYKWLLHNAKNNKIKSNFHAFNLDGKDFISNTVPKLLIETYRNSSTCSIHFTMNLPALAVNFLTSFRSLLKDYNIDEFEDFRKPIVHVYCFVSGEDSVKEAKDLVESNLNYELNENLIEIFNVRNVSPNKEMYRVTFYLTKEVLYNGDALSISNKRKRTDSEN